MIFNATVFGAGSGGVLIVNAPAGVIVTAVNEASGKTYNHTANDDGIAIFKGLINGVWELSITDGERTSESIFVEITTNYKTTLAFFEAYINVTYPANSTCTCTSKADNTVVFTDVNNTDAEKTITFTVPYKDTWTLNVTDGNQTDTMEVEITSEEQEGIVTLAYFKAYIDVTYPSGSTCTCSNGTTTLTDPNTTGQVIFNIPEAGTWTVSCTDGTNSKSQSVSITTEGQSVSVALSYRLVLFDGGDNIDITGGWSAHGRNNPAAVVGTTLGLNINTSQQTAWQKNLFIVGTNNTIDLSGYTKLCATIETLNATNGEACVVPEIVNDTTASASAAANVGTVEVDISAVTSGKIGLRITITSNAYGAIVGSISASRVWLE